MKKKSLPYYQCQNTNAEEDNDELMEVLLLHGAKFTKEDWKSNGILDLFCNAKENVGTKMTFTAVDLSVQSSGEDVHSAFVALQSAPEDKSVLTGNPVVVISPSASGKGIVELGEYYNEKTKLNQYLTKIIKAWIPVASPAVLKASESSIKSFAVAKVPVLAINGDKDAMGDKVTKRLYETLSKTDGGDVEAVVLEGTHPCYIDSPDDFVNTVLTFIAKLK